MLQEDCALTYSGHNIYLKISFCQDLLQGHILAILDPDAPIGLPPLLTPPASAGLADVRQHVMRFQVLLVMVKDLLTKEEAG